MRVRPPRIYAGYVLDLDGTVYLGEEPLPGAVRTLHRLRTAGARLVFLTNNPLRSPASYAALLRGMGIAASEQEVVTPLSVLPGYLARHHPGARVLTVAEPLVGQTLRANGIATTTDPGAAQVVLVSFDRTFDYGKMLAAFQAVHGHGAVIVATNPDPYCPSPDGGLPDCAAMLAAIEACTGARAEAVLGKPGPQMAAEVRARLGVPAADAAMVGDRLLTDVAMSRELEMTSVLVLSGATREADLASQAARSGGPRPDFVIAGLADLLPGHPSPSPPSYSQHQSVPTREPQ
ncbi:MAG TPA: HAD-IIA family hydrolase [Streptosporangiaceae bacterium]